MSKKTTEEEKRYYPLDWDEAAIVGLHNQGEPVVEDVSIPVDTRQRLFSPNVRVAPMPTGNKNYGKRADGTDKGSGWLGEIRLPNGNVATEYSVGVGFDGKEVEIPTLVPTLTPEEIAMMRDDIIPNNKQVPDSIMEKAIAHARQMMAEGKSVWAPNAVQPMGGSAPEAKSDPAVQTELERRLAETQSMLAGMQASADIAAQQQAAQDAYAGHFANLLAQNEAYRQQQSQLWEQREKESRSRRTIAAVSDALSSLGNLVGTSRGAFNQPQTYQMPFVQRGIEQERALARNTADRLRATDLSLQNGAAGAGLNNPFALENLRHQHTMEQIGAKGRVNSALEEQRQQGRETLKDMYYKYKGDYDKMMADLKRQGIQIQRDRLDEAIRHNQAIEDLRGQYGGGGVSGYTTETTIHRNDYGQETGRTTTRTPAPRPGVNDQPSTRTTTKTGGFNTGKPKKEEEKEKKEKKGGFRTR